MISYNTEGMDAPLRHAKVLAALLVVAGILHLLPGLTVSTFTQSEPGQKALQLRLTIAPGHQDPRWDSQTCIMLTTIPVLSRTLMVWPTNLA